ncbi:MAG: site-specific DNA-methyltransferase, partial [Acinetobacter johnsonii]
HDHILVYRKSNLFNRNLLPRTEEQNKPYKNDDGDGRGLWRSDNLLVKSFSQTAVYPIVNPNTGKEYFPPQGSSWRANKVTMQQWLNENRIYFGKDGTGAPQLKRYLNEVQDGRVPTTWWTFEECGHNDAANKELRTLFEIKPPFDTPKPTKLLKQIIHVSTDKNDIVLDFFAGSSTTADALMQFNAEDGGNRKFIMVQLPEDTDEKSEAYNLGYKNIAEISKDRIRRAGKKILTDNAGKEGIENLDIGFRVLKIDSTNMKDVYYTPDALKQADMLDLADHIKSDRTSEDLLFQVMLDWGLELSLPIERKTIAGKEVFYVAGNSLVACFDDLAFDVVDEVAKDHPLRFVSAEKAIHLDHDKTNIKERFKQLSPDTEVKFL